MIDDRDEECILVGYGTAGMYRLMTKKTHEIILARDCKLDETILGFGNARNTCEPLYYDDQISDSESIEPTEPFAARAPEPDEEEP